MINKTQYTHKKESFNKSRNFILDVMREGKKNSTIYANIEIDISEPLQKINSLKKTNNKSISLTAYLSRCLSIAINKNRIMHAIRKNKDLIIYDEIDIAFMIEREVDGALQPVNYIIRGTNKKSTLEIQEELRTASKAPIGKSHAMNKYEYHFWKSPNFLRKLVWFVIRRSPKLKKTFVGTVGLTSMGMFGSGNINIYPITPMTLTLSVGTIEKKLIKINGEIKERNILHTVLCANHDIIDGAPLIRFSELFKKIVQEASELPTLKKPKY